MDACALIYFTNKIGDLDVQLIKHGNNKDIFLIPTPALSEFLIMILDEEEQQKYLELFSSPPFQILSFDKKSAIELSIRNKNAIKNGDKREGSNDAWQKVKFDRQILSIALVSDSNEVWSQDLNVISTGKKWGLNVINPENIKPPQSEMDV